MAETEKTKPPSFERFYERHQASAQLCAHLLMGPDEADGFLKSARPDLQTEFETAGIVLDFSGWMVEKLIGRTKKPDDKQPATQIRQRHAEELAKDLEALEEDREVASEVLRKMPMKERDFLLDQFVPKDSAASRKPSDESLERIRNLSQALFCGISRRRAVKEQTEELEKQLLGPILSGVPGKLDALPGEILNALSKSQNGRGLQRRVANLQLILPTLCKALRNKLANPVVVVEKESIAKPVKGGMNVAILGIALAALAVAAGLYSFAKQRSMVKIEIPPDPARVTIIAQVDAKAAEGMPPIRKNTVLTNNLLKIISGQVILDLNTHTMLLVTGPAEMTFKNSAVVQLTHGTVVARNRGRKNGLKIHTPHVILTDRAAEMGIGVTKDLTGIEMIRGQADAKSSRLETLFAGDQKSYPDGRSGNFTFMRAFPPVPLPAASGIAEPREWPLNRAGIPKLKLDRFENAPVIDAKLDDWTAESLFSVNAVEHPESYSAKLGLSYDDEALYFSGFVVDPHPMRSQIAGTSENTSFLSGGGVQLRLQSIGSPETNTSPAVLADLWFNKADEVANSAIRRADKTNLMPAEVTGAFALHTNLFLYTFEYALPWKVIGIPVPKSGDSLRASVEIVYGSPSGKDWIGSMTELIDFRAFSRNPTNRIDTATKPHSWGKIEFR
jgi:hypothetical protein